MKKTLFAFAAVVAALVSCQKEMVAPQVDLNENRLEQNDRFMVSLEGTKTTIDDSLQVKWTEGDSISVNGVIYELVDIYEDSTRAEFKKRHKDQPSPSAPFNACFPADWYNPTTQKQEIPDTIYRKDDQDFSMPMTAVSDTRTMAFTNSCGVLAISVSKKEAESVKVISVSDDKLLKTIICNSAVTPDTAGTTFYVPLAPGQYKSLVVDVYKTKAAQKPVTEMFSRAEGGITINANTLYAISYKTSLKGITLSKQTDTLDIIGKDTLTVICNPINATNKDVEWESTADSIATVDAEGHIKAIKEGETLIIATSKEGAYKDTCTLTVLDFSIKSLAFIPETTKNDHGIIKGKYRFYGGANKDTLVGGLGVANYRVNDGKPARISTNVEDWKFVNSGVDTLLEVTNVTYSGDSITVSFKFKKEPQEEDLVALQTETGTKEGKTITSDSSYVNSVKDIKSFCIIHKHCYNMGGLIKYRNTLENKSEANDCDRCSSDTKDAVFDVSDLNYDKECDLKDFVETIFEDSFARKLSNYGLTVTYEFKTADHTDVYTEDNSTINLTPEGIMTIAPEVKPNTPDGKCNAVGKTPCIQVKAKVGDVEIACAEMKILIKGRYFFMFRDSDFKLNPNYLEEGAFGKLLGKISEDTALELKGKRNKIGHIEIIPTTQNKSLQAHFWENYKHFPTMWDNGKIRFSIMNYGLDDIYFTDPSSGQPCINCFGSSATYPNGRSYVEFTKAQWENYRDSVHLNPAIEIKNNGILDPDRYVLMKITEKTYTNYNYYVQEDSSVYYYVVFKSLMDLQVKLNSLTFETVDEPDIKDDIPQYATLVDASGNEIFDWDFSKKSYKITEAAKTIYPQTDYPALYTATVTCDTCELTYPYDTQESFDSNLSKNGEYGIAWNFLGITLTKEKKAAYTVKLKISSEGKEYTRTGQSDLIIHKTVE